MFRHLHCILQHPGCSHKASVGASPVIPCQHALINVEEGCVLDDAATISGQYN